MKHFLNISTTLLIFFICSHLTQSIEWEDFKSVFLLSVPNNYNTKMYISNDRVAFLGGVHKFDPEKLDIGYLASADTTGKNSFNIEIKQNNMPLYPQSLEFSDNEITVISQVITGFDDNKEFSKLNLRKYDFSGNELYNYMGELNTINSGNSSFRAKFDKNGNPLAIYTTNIQNYRSAIQADRYDSEGKYIETKVIDSSEYYSDGHYETFEIEDFIVSDDGNYYGFGIRKYFENDKLDTTSAFVFKIDNKLNLSWKKVFYPETNNNGFKFNNVIENKDNELVLIGNDLSISMTKSGIVIDTAEIKTNAETLELVGNVIQSNSGHYFITGNAENEEGVINEYVARLGEDRNVIWEYYHGPFKPKKSYLDIFEYKPGNFYILETGSATVGLYEFEDNITSVENNFETEKIFLHPNPTNGKVNIDLKGIESVSVYNLQMQEVKTIGNIGTNTIDITELQAGVYFLEVEDVSGDVYFEKVVKR